MPRVSGVGKGYALVLELLGRALSEIGALVIVFGPLDAGLRNGANFSVIFKESVAGGVGLIIVGILFERLGRKWLDEDEMASKNKLLAKVIYGGAVVLEADPGDRPRVIRTIGHRIISS